MDLNPDLHYEICSYGFKHPTEIQSLAIKPIYLGRSVVAQSPFVSGKTSAYTIGIIQSIKTEEKTTQALVLTPNDTSAYQTCILFQRIGKRIKDFQVSIFKELDSNQLQKEEEAMQSHVFIATPKKALKMIEEGILRCENLKIVCLDEADFILKDEGIDRIKEILGFIKPDIQILMFSYKITPHIINIMDGIMHDPVKIIKENSYQLEKIRQYFICVDKDEYKFPTLFDIFGQLLFQRVIIFANKKDTVHYLQKQFQQNNFDAIAFHEGLEQKEIDECINEFLERKNVIVSTDNLLTYASINLISFIINFEMPDSPEQYLNRLKKSINYGRRCITINICNTKEFGKITEFQNYFKTKIEEMPYDYDIYRDENYYY